jgi:hypothetical protein
MNTITAGKKDILDPDIINSERVRRSGGGPKFIDFYHPDIQENIRKIIDSSSYGNPEQPLTWTTMSHRKICTKFKSTCNIEISHGTIGSILEILGYSGQTNRKMLQIGTPHPDRNAQFHFINSTAEKFITSGDPVISVDTKKKELIGNFQNMGQEYRKHGDARKVLDHDFPIKELGKVAPYGIYNINHNTGFINLGISHDTAEFAVESISRWWDSIGKETFPNASKLLITCDCGGSNGYRLKLWKYQLFQLAKRIHIDIHVTHFPQGTSKWNKVEHRLFCYISKNWRGKPLIDIPTVINLISTTTTVNNLKVICVQDKNTYELSKKVSTEEFNSIPIIKTPPFEEWNYIIQCH